jgi:hypothetical protein
MHAEDQETAAGVVGGGGGVIWREDGTDAGVQFLVVAVQLEAAASVQDAPQEVIR